MSGKNDRLRRWTSYTLKHLANALALAVGVLAFSFCLFHLAPGDPARVILGPNATEQQVAALRHSLGYDQPLLTQAVAHFRKMATLEFGRSIVDGRPVLGLVLPKFAITATIGLQAAILSLLFSYGLNLLVFSQPRTAPLLGILRFGVLLPVFLLTVLAALAIGFFLPQFSLSRDSAAFGPFRQILPSLIACLYPVAVMTTILRERILESMTRPAYRASRAYGAIGWRLFHCNLFRPSSVPWLAAWVNQLSLVFFASLVLEVILSIPGSGTLLLNAIQARDFPVLQGIIVINGAFFIIVTWLADELFPILDPRTA
jgi:ABC-type dipeptide/oligopeptide/nickel transport system permease component